MYVSKYRANRNREVAVYKRVKADQVQKRSRKSESRFESTPEWKAMKADIDAGYPKATTKGGVAEALVLSLTDEDKERIGIANRRTVARFVQKYIKDQSLHYEVKSFRREDMDFVVVKRA